ncbi:MAG: hypothetical protein H2172_03930 [Opitutus sp.]|nr:hypothetical protein [Opitutus sp.]MCS6246399.1 hypothetical protein [Opitutus sp.]MCS6273257.1 hypothetical protein [Opitutus sp.]MCS6277967.1 hypothetical protein [Opitutus sp.]MCS6298926.1 hypothetical protein [Opitutus sp.]
MHPKAKNYLIILLTAATACSGYLAWQQSQRLAVLQDELLKAFPAKTARKERPAPITAELPMPASKTVTTAAIVPAAPPEEAAKPNQKRSNARPDFTALMANPEFAQAMSLQQRGSLDGRYADLFEKLKLAPAELEKLKTLLIERQTTRMDVMTSARAQGLDPRANSGELRKLTASAQAEVDDSIKTSLGESVYAQFQAYENTQPQRGLVSQLDQRLSYTGTPLNANQTEFLVKALAASPGNTATADALGGFGNRPSATLSDAIIQQAQSVLTPDQVAALKQLQAEQMAQKKMHDLMRNPPGSGTATRK